MEARAIIVVVSPFALRAKTKQNLKISRQIIFFTVCLPPNLYIRQIICAFSRQILFLSPAKSYIFISRQINTQLQLLLLTACSRRLHASLCRLPLAATTSYLPLSMLLFYWYSLRYSAEQTSPSPHGHGRHLPPCSSKRWR